MMVVLVMVVMDLYDSILFAFLVWSSLVGVVTLLTPVGGQLRVVLDGMWA